MSKETILRMLDTCNISGFEHLLVSSESKKTKHTGNLFGEYKNLYPKNYKFLHIGDNEHSDGSMAIKAGLAAFPLTKSADLNEIKITKDTILESHKNPKEKFILSMMQSLITNKIDDYRIGNKFISKGFDETPYILGYSLLGPVFSGVTQFIIEITKEKKYKNLFFASRDGYHLKLAYDNFAKYIPELPPSFYFYSSRRLANSSGLITEDDIHRVAKIDFAPTSLKNLMQSRYNLSAQEIGEIPNKYFLECNFADAETLINQESHQENFIKFSKLQSKLIISRNSLTNQFYKEYLEKIGLKNDDSAIVDIGYSGTIQSAISKLLEINISGIYFITWKRIEQLDKLKLDYKSFMGDKVDSSHPFNKYIQLFELLLSATHPSVAGIDKKSDGTFLPIFSDHRFDNKTLFFLSEIRRGANDFITNYLQSGIHEFNIFETLEPSDFTNSIFNFFSNPTYNGAKFFKAIQFEDDFGGNKQSLINDFSRASALGSSVEESLISSSLWKEGARVLFNEGKNNFNLKNLNNFNISDSSEDQFTDKVFNDFLLPGYLNERG